MAKKRSPFDIEPSNITGYNAMNEKETAEVIEQRFGPPEIGEEDHMFNLTLLDADINPLDEKWQRPTGTNNKDNYGD
jgi:hypothetical protein